MRKETKNAMIEQYEAHLAFLDELIDENIDNEPATDSLLEQYKQTAKFLAEIVKIKTTD